MALTPMQFGPKKDKKSGWDKVAQAMQMAGTAVGIANGVSDFSKGVSASPPGDLDNNGAMVGGVRGQSVGGSITPPDPMKTNAMLRRYGTRYA